MITRRRFSGLLALAVLPGMAKAVDTDTSIAAVRAKYPTPALAAVGQLTGRAPVLQADGARAIGSGVAVTTADLWHLGSITKSMTACLVARLAEAQALSWDDNVGKVLSGVDMQAQYREATFRHLLTHRSGLPSNVGALDYVRYSKFLSDAREERKDYARRSLGMTPVGPAGKTFEYSNNGYVVAGAMIEAITGKAWETLMTEQVFAPLGLKDAGFGPPGTAGRLDQPLGHMKGLFGGLRAIQPDSGDADNPAAMAPCGGVHASLSDMAAYLMAHRDRTDFLSAASWQTLHTPADGGDYAMGWFVRKDGKLQHGGWNRRWVSLAHIDPAKSLIAFAATNNGDQATANPAVEHGVNCGLTLAEQV